ncbi:MAG: hypothetical protein IKG96_07495 [Bacteroidaceae bacterium]|nr:hypothetical protein [Bacteroidaceae bacterium]
MKKINYQQPNIIIIPLYLKNYFLQGSTETLPFDPGDGTEESLSKENKSWNSLWDDPWKE